MARRRGPRDARMGAGSVAAGDLQHGERQVVEQTAMSPMAAGQTGGPQAPAPGPPGLGMAVDPFAPTAMPDQPMTAGLGPDEMSSPNPADVLAAMYRRFPYPDLRRLLERAQATDWDAMGGGQQPVQPPMPDQGGMMPGLPMGGEMPMVGPDMMMDQGY